MKKLVSTAVGALFLMLTAGPTTTATADPVSTTIPYGANKAEQLQISGEASCEEFDPFWETLFLSLYARGVRT